ncbi:MAG: hypothetical protein DMD79_09930 [Candidatus Rokuibacteriota bacterium]|nr:MAG: hypothetical protein DMD79_09930 [Candidatus Rokubacteria bacterium]
MRTAFSEVPRAWLESAALDGASLPTIVARNEFLFPLIVTSLDAKPGSVAIMSFGGGYKKLQWGSLA